MSIEEYLTSDSKELNLIGITLFNQQDNKDLEDYFYTDDWIIIDREQNPNSTYINKWVNGPNGYLQYNWYIRYNWSNQLLKGFRFD